MQKLLLLLVLLILWNCELLGGGSETHAGVDDNEQIATGDSSSSMMDSLSSVTDTFSNDSTSSDVNMSSSDSNTFEQGNSSEGPYDMKASSSSDKEKMSDDSTDYSSDEMPLSSAIEISSSSEEIVSSIEEPFMSSDAFSSSSEEILILSSSDVVMSSVDITSNSSSSGANDSTAIGSIVDLNRDDYVNDGAKADFVFVSLSDSLDLDRSASVLDSIPVELYAVDQSMETYISATFMDGDGEFVFENLVLNQAYRLKFGFDEQDMRIYDFVQTQSRNFLILEPQ